MLNRHNFEIAALAPQDEDRLTLCGVYVTPESTMVTDGRQAVVVSSVEATQPGLFPEMEGVEPADFFSPFILDRESALKVAKAIPKKALDEARYAIVDATTEGAERAMVSVNDMYRQEVLRAKKIPGTFPDVSKVFKDPEKAKYVMAIDPHLLVEVLKAVQKFCKGHDTGSITLRYFGTGDALRIDAEGIGQTFAAVVMPLKSELSK